MRVRLVWCSWLLGSEALLNGAERADYDAYYRILNASPVPLQWDVPIGEGQRLTLRRFLYSLLDQHVNNDLRTDTSTGFLRLLVASFLARSSYQRIGRHTNGSLRSLKTIQGSF